MKAERVPQEFRPITVTIESADELMVLKSALYQYYQGNSASPVPAERQLAHEMRGEIMLAEVV